MGLKQLISCAMSVAALLAAGVFSGGARAEKIANPVAVFDGLDKITATITTMEAKINQPFRFGALEVVARVCYTRPPTETPKTTAFVEVNEHMLNGEVRRIFTGWMFAANPGINAVEHPIYDVWLKTCKTDRPQAAASAPQAGSAKKSP